MKNLVKESEAFHPLVVCFQLDVKIREIRYAGEHHSDEIVGPIVQIHVLSVVLEEMLGNEGREDVVEETFVVSLEVGHLIFLFRCLGNEGVLKLKGGLLANEDDGGGGGEVIRRTEPGDLINAATHNLKKSNISNVNLLWFRSFYI